MCLLNHTPSPRVMERRWLRITQPRMRQLAILVTIVLFAASIVAGYLFRGRWLPQINGLPIISENHFHDGEGKQNATKSEHEETDGHSVCNVMPGGGETSLELSVQSQKNIGLHLVTVQLQDFDRSISVPAMVKGRPGRTEIKVSAPMTGIVTRIYPVQGEAVAPGQSLFDLRLTHEDLVDIQSTFLETIERLDVIKQEVARLEKVTATGAIAGKKLLERQYEQQQAEARRRAQQQALILHGLTLRQVQEIQANLRLLQQVTMVAPQPVEITHDNTDTRLLQVSQIDVRPGEHVSAGDPLCVLSDHALLYIEGRAFEEDSEELNQAANQSAPITAVIEANGEGTHSVSDLNILYLENEVEVDSRALRFYVRLPNELVRNEFTDDGHCFIGWRFKPGQRVQLRVPVERWRNCIVLPVDAVVKDGVDWFVFKQNGDRFNRKPVHVAYRDQRWAVIGNDGSLCAGDVVAVSGAYQMNLALLKKAGNGTDLHAGHGH
ncbi:MAG: efflux RND transporter periplasmic adaptor subunit [Pirellulales bacterium]|nr:efflux RND transporter periplasmic adaptor subunit [Pirellulales bacterium]